MPEHESILILSCLALSSSLFSLIISKHLIEFELKRLIAFFIFFPPEHFCQNSSVRRQLCGFGIQPCRLPAQEGHWRTINWAYEAILPESFLNFEFRVSRHVNHRKLVLSLECGGDSCPKKQMQLTLRNKPATALLQTWTWHFDVVQSKKIKNRKCLHQQISLVHRFWYHVANRLEGSTVKPVADVSRANVWFWSFSCETRWFDFFIIKDYHQTVACVAASGRGARLLFRGELSLFVIREMVKVQSKMENAWNAQCSQMALMAPSL